MKLLIKCENVSYGDGRTFCFGDVADIADKDAKCLLKTKQAVETSLPLTVDSKGNELIPAVAGVLDGGSPKATSNKR